MMLGENQGVINMGKCLILSPKEFANKHSTFNCQTYNYQTRYVHYDLVNNEPVIFVYLDSL